MTMKRHVGIPDEEDPLEKPLGFALEKPLAENVHFDDPEEEPSPAT